MSNEGDAGRGLTRRDLLKKAGILGADVHPDGRRFVMIADETGSRLTVVVNWFEELRQRMQASGRAG